MPNRDTSPLDDDKKTMILGFWRISIQSLAADEGQGPAEGALELRVSVELDPVDGGNSMHLTAGLRANASADQVIAGPKGGQETRTYLVKVRAVDFDGRFPKKEVAPDDSASTTLKWILKRGESSSLPVSLRLPEVGGTPGQVARVSMTLKASWDEEEVEPPGPPGPLERLPPVERR